LQRLQCFQFGIQGDDLFHGSEDSKGQGNEFSYKATDPFSRNKTAPVRGCQKDDPLYGRNRGEKYTPPQHLLRLRRRLKVLERTKRWDRQECHALIDRRKLG